MKTFYDLFEINKNDVIFGLDEKTIEYILLYAKNKLKISNITPLSIRHVMKNKLQSPPSFTVKHITTAFDIVNIISTLFQKNRNKRSISEIERFLTEEFKNKTGSNVQSSEVYRQIFNALITHEKYSIDCTSKEQCSRILRERQYENNTDLGQNAAWLALRRTSKLILEEILERNGAFRHSKVHFILDGINMNSVFDTTRKGGYHHNRTGFDFITSSELRYLYRNRQRYDIQSRVIFYSHFIPNPVAPWDNPLWKNLFSEYHPSSEVKTKPSSTNPAKRVVVVVRGTSAPTASKIRRKIQNDF
ncbi:TPA: hypothetical protein G8O00_000914 [Salmonella enterica]|uniref:Uncharacterized protein n=1 Tax=Salmonella enterica TaxID=28901 RepID=A0A747XJB1_SALER|nr:hypothetical protein [Salmonella enterica]HAF4697558.1 hypothetical protein [Salmonella enterica]